MFSQSSFFAFLSFAILFGLGVQNVLAHIELIYPPPINSKYDPQTPENKIDYSMTSPLATDGSNYPCKGYNTAENIDALKSVATLVAGDKLHINMSGSATHSGGSCQFALSYDEGKSFGVMTSIIGGCPLDLKYDITIPKEVPSKKKALFGWSWQNEVGNREEYMNCAVVDVQGTSQSLSLPGLFRANTLPDGTCQTVEGEDPVYPSPGPEVQYGGKMSKDSPVTELKPCSIDQKSTVVLKGDSKGSSGPSNSTSSSLPDSNSTNSSFPVPALDGTASSSVNYTTSGSDPNSNADSSSLSSETVPTPKDPEAGNYGQKQAPFAIPPPPASSTSTSSSGARLRCDSSSTFSLCDGEHCKEMGKVEDGMECSTGTGNRKGSGTVTTDKNEDAIVTKNSDNNGGVNGSRKTKKGLKMIAKGKRRMGMEKKVIKRRPGKDGFVGSLLPIRKGRRGGGRRVRTVGLYSNGA